MTKTWNIRVSQIKYTSRWIAAFGAGLLHEIVPEGVKYNFGSNKHSSVVPVIAKIDVFKGSYYCNFKRIESCY